MPGTLILSADGKSLLPYRWGAWCGVIALASAVLVLPDAITTAKETGPLVLLLELLVIAVSLAAGVGLLMRRRYGVILFFVFGGLRLLLKLAGSSDVIQIQIMIAGWLLIFFLPNLIYFRKRWHGFEKKQQ
jgi:hypothetical protein